MNLNEFNKFYPNNLLDKLSEEKKTVFLLGAFNINLLNYDQDTSTNEFRDTLSSHSFLPHILQPASVRSNSKTLADNIFYDAISTNVICGNIIVYLRSTAPISHSRDILCLVHGHKNSIFN